VAFLVYCLSANVFSINYLYRAIEFYTGDRIPLQNFFQRMLMRQCIAMKVLFLLMASIARAV